MYNEQENEQQKNISKAEKIVNQGKKRRRHVDESLERVMSYYYGWVIFVTQFFLLYQVPVVYNNKNIGMECLLGSKLVVFAKGKITHTE